MATPQQRKNANDLVYVHDLNERFTSVNKATERSTGYGSAEILQMNLIDLVAPGYLPIARQMIADTLEGSLCTRCELEILTRDGHRIVLEVSPRLIYVGGGITSIQGTARDITECKRLEAP